MFFRVLGLETNQQKNFSEGEGFLRSRYAHTYIRGDTKIQKQKQKKMVRNNKDEKSVEEEKQKEKGGQKKKERGVRKGTGGQRSVSTEDWDRTSCQ